MNLGIIFTVILLPLVLAEVGEISPWLARWVLRWGAKCIGDRDATERYTEEWLAGIEDTPGKITKASDGVWHRTVGGSGVALALTEVRVSMADSPDRRRARNRNCS